MATLFTKIINGEIPSEIVYQDEYVFAIRDINPMAPVHVLIITRAEIPGLSDIPIEGDHTHILNAAKKISEQLGLTSGYRLVINNGADAGQTVPHLHAHLLGGTKLGGFGEEGVEH
ncbi:MAG: histidine triad nucleotide-binding protein [Fimbriimonadaceae bacterium]